ncbi:MAG: hypothetical protein Q4E87_01065 [bacterium]|nr:hypothetical protein [bacterium]
MEFISGNLNAKDENGIYPFAQVYVDEKQTFGDSFPKSWRIMKQSNTKEKVDGVETGNQVTKLMAYPAETYSQLAKMKLLSTLTQVPKTPLIVHDNLSSRDLTGTTLTLKDDKYKIGFQHTSRAQGVSVNWAFDAFQIDVAGDGYAIK